MVNGQPYILLIDDDTDDLEMLSSALVEIGIRVKTFESSTKAMFYLNLVSGNKDLPSLIIMDYNMPRNNGFDVLVFLKNNPEISFIPVLIYSTTVSPVLREKLIGAGAAGCFNKSVTYKEFTHQVRLFDNQFLHLNDS